MASMNIFQNDAFTAISLTAAIERIGYIPSLLGSIPGLIDPRPVRTEAVWIESGGGGPALIRFTPRGAPPEAKSMTPREARAFKTLRIAERDRLYATEIQGVRAFGSESELMGMQEEIAHRQLLLRRDNEMTMEYHRLNLIQGLVKDVDGTTKYNWATELGQSFPSEIDFDLDNAAPASGAVRTKCNEVRRLMLRNLEGLGGESIQIMALVGDTFYDQFTAHPEVRQTYLNTVEAQQLRNGNAFSRFNFGDITWINYRSTDDGGATPTIGVPTTKAKLFPVGAGIFQMAYAPAETFDFVNTLGKPTYSWLLPDNTGMNAYMDVMLYSYPLPVCVQPKALISARNT